MDDDKRPFALMLGLAGGGTVGYWAFEHMFKTGLEPDEKKQIAGFLVATGTLLVVEGFGYGNWFSIEGLGAKLDKLLGVSA